MKLFFTPLLVLGSSAVLAQPVMNISDMTPVLGQAPVQYGLSDLQAGPSGANFTFNTGPVSILSTNQVQYVLPSSTPYASSFPGATMASAGLVNPDNYGYMKVDATGLYMMGMQGPTSSVIYNNTEKLFPASLAFNGTWTDTWSASVLAGGFDIARSGNTNGVYDGYGTLILPWGTFQVVRIKITQAYSDMTAGTEFATYQSELISYIQPGTAYTLLGITQLTMNMTGMEPVVSRSVTAMDSTVAAGIAERGRLDADALVFPNPASGMATLRLGKTHRGATQVSVLDVLGREVDLIALSANGMVTDVALDVAGYTAGTYVLRLTGEHGAVRSLPFTVQ